MVNDKDVVKADIISCCNDLFNLNISEIDTFERDGLFMVNIMRQIEVTVSNELLLLIENEIGKILKKYNHSYKNIKLFFSRKKKIVTAEALSGIASKKKGIDGVKHIIMIASGKGGVGKSTLSANLALSLASMGWRTALLDADIYGASIPTIFGLGGTLIDIDEISKKMQPIAVAQYENLIFNSINFITKSNEPLIWRGPMIVKALNQLIKCADYKDVDFMIIDTPPGTGDIHLTLLENYHIDRVLFVTTGHQTALNNTEKTILMCKQFGINEYDIVINNMFNQDLDKIESGVIKNAQNVFRLPLFSNNIYGDLFSLDKKNTNYFHGIARSIAKKVLYF